MKTRRVRQRLHRRRFARFLMLDGKGKLVAGSRIVLQKAADIPAKQKGGKADSLRAHAEQKLLPPANSLKTGCIFQRSGV